MTTKDPESLAQTLPLYDSLITKVSSSIEINEQYKTRLASVLGLLSKEQAEQIAMLIIHHYFVNNIGNNPFVKEKVKVLPYGMKISPSGKGFSFDLDIMPSTLQALLGIYCQV